MKCTRKYSACVIMYKEKLILKTAIISRVVLFLIQYFSNIIIPDHEAGAFRYPKSNHGGIFDQLVEHLFGGFVRWDAQHFVHIAKYGYTYEHNLAFFPLSPYLVRYVALLLSHITPFLNFDSLILIVFLFINGYCFCQSTLCLYKLSLNFMSEDLAFKSSILFCFNPASIFFSAPYTESLFSYLTFKSVLNCVVLYKKYCDIHQHLQVKDILYIIPICLSTCTRSNSVLNIGFLVYTLICLFLDTVHRKKQTFNKILYGARLAILTIFLICFCMIPFILFQMYCYYTFCTNFETDLPVSVLSHKDIETFVLPGSFLKHNQSWCFKKIPLAYSYIQSHYWKVGFLQYYEFKQIPNFLLASPLIFILFNGAINFLKHFPKKLSVLFNFNNIFHKPAKFSSAMLVFVVHAAALTLFCVLNIHVQVTTRMLCSASPVLYWFCAYKISDFNVNSIFQKLTHPQFYNCEYFVLIYFLSYYIIGTIMFCNFLPWT